MMRVCSLLALGAVLVAGPAFAENVNFSLLGTTDGVATRDITVGPDILDCAFCTSDTVSDINMTAGLGSSIELGPDGGMVNVFFLAGVAGPSDGLMSFVGDFASSGPAGVTFSPFNFDTVFQDVDGRTASFLGMTANIPTERRIAGSMVADSGPYFQSWTGPFAASTGLAGGSLTDVGAGSSALDTTSTLHTFSIGQVGNDQTEGPTALGHFSVDVPGVPGTYEISASAQSLLTYVDGPQFGSPPNPSAVVQEGDLRGSEVLTITVTPEPSTLLMLLPVAALLRRRR
jgi:hypothetical protein